MTRRFLIGMLSLLCLAVAAVPLHARNRQIDPKGEPHVFTVLLEFRNVRFSVENPQMHFTDMLNGRVREYYSDNSCGLFSPVFDVYGPVLLDAPMSAYGADVMEAGERIGDTAPDLALLEACSALDGKVDFSRYDADGDGVIDLLLFYYAGYDQAEGGPSDAIWSHNGDLSDHPAYSDFLFDGKRPGYYFCTAELRGSEGNQPIGIGSTVHEMGHALGLPDFYDTDKGNDGLAGGLYQFSPMADGMYNNNGDTPPYLNALERILLGWMDEESLAPLQEGWMYLSPIQERMAAVSATGTEGEFFLYEYRSGQGWDAPLPAGLIVYHVDRSSREIDGIPALTLWNDWRKYNKLNARGDHPCFYVVPPLDPDNLNYAAAVNPGTLVFPGSGQVHCFEPKDWAGRHTGIQITCMDIDRRGGRFLVLERKGTLISGMVQDAGGAPMAGVSVRLMRDGEGVVASDRSGMDGCFLLPVEKGSGGFVLSAEMAGYRPVSEEITVENNALQCVYLQLFASEDPASVRLQKYNPAASPGYFPSDEAVSAAVRFTAEELAPYVGGRIGRITCYPYITDPLEAGQMYITVDIGGRRAINQPVLKPVLGEYLPVSVNLAVSNLRIPPGVDIYIGYAFQTQGANYPLAAVYPGSEGNSYYAPFSFYTQDWTPLYLDKAGFYMDLMLDAEVEEVSADSLPEMGFSSILLREGPYKTGETLDLQVLVPKWEQVNRITWYLDGKPLEGTSITTARGEYTLEARLDYWDGRVETLGTELIVY